jgi:hypothetical protein
MDFVAICSRESDQFAAQFAISSDVHPRSHSLLQLQNWSQARLSNSAPPTYPKREANKKGSYLLLRVPLAVRLMFYRTVTTSYIPLNNFPAARPPFKRGSLFSSGVFVV